MSRDIGGNHSSEPRTKMRTDEEILVHLQTPGSDLAVPKLVRQGAGEDSVRWEEVGMC